MLSPRIISAISPRACALSSAAPRSGTLESRMCGDGSTRP